MGCRGGETGVARALEIMSVDVAGCSGLLACRMYRTLPEPGFRSGKRVGQVVESAQEAESLWLNLDR